MTGKKQTTPQVRSGVVNINKTSKTNHFLTGKDIVKPSFADHLIFYATY